MKSKTRTRNNRHTKKTLFKKATFKKSCGKMKRGNRSYKSKRGKKDKKQHKRIKQIGGDIQVFGYNIPKITTSLISKYMVTIAQNNVTNLSFDIEPQYELYNFDNQDQLWQFLTSLSKTTEFKDTILWHIVNSKGKESEDKPFNYPDFPGIIKVILSIAMSPSLLLAYYLDDIQLNKSITRHSTDILDQLTQINSKVVNKTFINAIRLLFLNDDLMNINATHIKKPTQNIDIYWIALTIILLFIQEAILKQEKIIDNFGYLDEIVKTYDIITENLPVTFVLLEQIALKQTTIHGIYRQHKHTIGMSDNIPLTESITISPHQPTTSYTQSYNDIIQHIHKGEISEAITKFESTVGVQNLKHLQGIYQQMNTYRQVSIGADRASIDNVLRDEIELDIPPTSQFNNNIGLNNMVDFGSENNVMEYKGIANKAPKNNQTATRNVKIFEDTVGIPPETELELDFMAVLEQFENPDEDEENQENNIIRPVTPSRVIRRTNTIWEKPPEPSMNQNKIPKSIGYVPSTGKPRRSLHRRINTSVSGGGITRTISTNSLNSVSSSISNNGNNSDNNNATTKKSKPKKQNRRDEMVNMTQYKNVLAYLYPDSYQPNIGKEKYNILLPPAVLLILSIKLNHEGLTKQDNIFLNGKLVPELLGCQREKKTECRSAKLINHVLDLIRQVEEAEILKEQLHQQSVTMGIPPKYADQLFDIIQSAKIQGTLGMIKMKLNKLLEQISGTGEQPETKDDKINADSFYKLINNIIPENIRHCSIQQSGGVFGGFHLLYPSVGNTFAKGIKKIGKGSVRLASETKRKLSEGAYSLKVYAGEVVLGVRDLNNKICKNDRISFSDLNPIINRLHWRITKNTLNYDNYASIKAKKSGIAIGDQYFVRNTFSPILYKFPIEVGFIGKLFLRKFKHGENKRHKKYMLMMYNIRFLQFICYQAGIYSDNFVKTAIYQLFGKDGKYKKDQEEFFTIVESINISTMINHIKREEERRLSKTNNVIEDADTPDVPNVPNNANNVDDVDDVDNVGNTPKVGKPKRNSWIGKMALEQPLSK